MEKNLKKRLALALLLCILICAFVPGTAAYFTATGTARNTVTAGNIQIELVETALTPGGATVPFENAVGIMPGSTVSKIVQVKNTGAQNAYVRVRLEKNIRLAPGASGEVDPTLVSYAVNTSAWTQSGDYYYYNSALTPGALTPPLVTEVRFSPAMGNVYQNAVMEIIVHAAATQTANNGASALAAAGWPADT